MTAVLGIDYYRRQRKVIEQVRAERDRQDKLWGPIPRGKSEHQWLAFLTEEVGEVAKALNEHDRYPHIREELVHVAAVAVAAVEDLDHQRGSEPSAPGGTEVRR